MQNPFLNTAVTAARTAGNIIARASQRLDLIKISEKSPHDYVTNIDTKVEKVIIDIIQTAYPDHAFLGEEGGDIGDSDHVNNCIGMVHNL